MQIDVRAEIEKAEKGLYRYEKRVIPRATNSSLNKTATNVRTQAHRRLSQIIGLPIKELKPYTGIRRSTLLTLSSQVFGRRRAFNMIKFVVPSKRAPGAFRKQRGVKAKPWRRAQLLEGTFIIRGRTHGRPVVVARKGDERYPLKSIYGPSLHVEFNRPPMRRFMSVLAKRRFRVNFSRDLRYYISRAG